MGDCDVLIAGAGPTGLVLALWLNRLGVKVRIIDKAAKAGTTSRALAVQARTLELYEQLDLTGAVVDGGYKTLGAHLWVKGKEAAHVAFGEIGQGQSPAPFFLVYSQDLHERLLIDRLAKAGVTVERPVELVHYIQDAKGVTARLRGARGHEETCHAAYLAGCDGAHSVVRHGIGVTFPGGTYDRMFYVADVDAEGPSVNGELNVDLDSADFLAMFPLDSEGHVRLIGAVRDDKASSAAGLTFDDVSDQAIEHMQVKVKRVNWFSTYHVHHRVAERFSKGRAFILGDAAHIHSPVGGQGMNTGIGDAINLAWKLAAVIQGKANKDLLDTYETERIAFAKRLVASTDQGFTFVTAEGPWADFVRTKIAPLVIPPFIHAAQEFLFRTVGQLNLEYHASSLSEGHAGHVKGGDRLPWVQSADNFKPLAEPVWQVHVYGQANHDLEDRCKALGVPLHRFAWTEACGKAGLVRDALYLMRPDTYVALVDSSGSARALERYFEQRGIKP